MCVMSLKHTLGLSGVFTPPSPAQAQLNAWEPVHRLGAGTCPHLFPPRGQSCNSCHSFLQKK